MAEIAPRSDLSPLAVAAVSLLLPGAGHLWIGQRKKGALIAVGGLFTCWMCGLWNLLAAVDAWGLARKLVSGQPIGEVETSRFADTLDNLFG